MVIVKLKTKKENMDYLTLAILGLIGGTVGKFLLPGKDPGGLIMSLIIGVIGAFIGGFLGKTFGFGAVTGLDVTSIILAVAGSIVFLILYRILFRRRR